ncbi:hypothetical protein PFISCL1PPCAC_11304, partial [Pristionchus fissidentatus]
ASYLASDGHLILPQSVSSYAPSTSRSSTDSISSDSVEVQSKRARPPTICAICGDKAAGRNYEVPSCYGCKSFFRRTLQREDRFFCKNDGKCKNSISKDVRIRCRACRFDRCVEEGMNPMAVDAIKDKDSNRTIHEIVRRQEQARSLTRPSTSRELIPLESSIDCAIEELLYLEVAHQKLRRSQFNPTSFSNISIEWCLLGPSRMGIEFGDMPIACPPPAYHVPYLPMEVRVRERIPFPPKPEGYVPPPTFKKWVLTDLVYTIEWLKTFSFFQQLEEKEKIQLVKNVTHMVSLLTAAFFSYDILGSDVTVMPDGCVLFDGILPKEAKIERANIFGIIKRLKALNMDRKEYVLVKAVMACDPDHECFSRESREGLQHQRELFAKSLMSYVLAKRGAMEGPRAFTQMLSLISWQMGVARKYKDLWVLVTALDLLGRWMPKMLKE